MEAKLKYEFLDCWNKTYEKVLHKEESQDCVVPDTLPDIAQVLYTLGGLLIRSKDVSAGRLKLEANIPAKLVFRDEEGALHSMELNVPVYMSAEDESLGDGSFCTAEMKLTALETRLLNPRKVLVKAEVCAEVCCFNKGEIAWSTGIEGQEHIHIRQEPRELSFVSAVTEKTFALTDEQALPAGVEAGELISGAVEVFADDVKQLGSKLVLKGRVKSRMLMLRDNSVTPLEATTDFSQIIECSGLENSLVNVFITPSGAYHYVSNDGAEPRLCMEFHMVAQVKCSASKTVLALADAYSNEYELKCDFTDYSCEKLVSQPGLRCGARQLYELREVAEVLCCGHIWGSVRASGETISVPLTVQCLYRDEGGLIKSEKLSTEISIDGAEEENCRRILKSLELSECALATMPGGVELRVSAQAETVLVCRERLSGIGGISYDEDAPIDISRKPSIVLLRASSGDDLWTLARENCSTVKAIVEANALDAAGEVWEKLILIPKSF